MTDYETFKLVPLHSFKKLIEQSGNGGEESIAAGVHDSSPSQAMSESHIHAGEGGGAEDSQKIVWNHENSNTLPKYSNKQKIATSLDEYEAILNSKIPQHLKVKLLDFYRQKYMNSMQNVEADNSSDYSSDDDDGIGGNHKSNTRNMEVALHRVLSNIRSTEKRDQAKSIMEFFIKNRKIVTWDKNGNIVKPSNISQSISTVGDFINILIYRNKGTLAEISTVVNTVKPIIKQISPFISNKKIVITPRNLSTARGHVKPNVGCVKNKKIKGYITVK